MKYVCKRCESHGEPSVARRGSPLAEVTLVVLGVGAFLLGEWAAFAVLVVGLTGVSVYGRGGRFRYCQVCGSREVMPETAPAARAILSRP